MTMPDINFVDQSVPIGQSFDIGDLQEAPVEQSAVVAKKMPPPVINIGEEAKEKFLTWIDEWLVSLINDQQKKLKDFAEQEKAYRALPDANKTKPYIGADTTVVPAIAMAVDPIHARLSTGIFKQDPVFQIKGLKKSILEYVPSLIAWVDFYQKHKLKLRQVASPRILECAKLGTCVFKTVYDREASQIKTYDKEWAVVDKVELRFAGPRVFGLSIGDFLFPPRYQHLQQCPIVAERIRASYSQLLTWQAEGKITNVKDVEGTETNEKTDVELAREEMTDHQQTSRYHDEITLYEIWCDYDIDGNGLPEHLVATYHRETRTLLQLRYNWFFHQRKPYTIIPYTVTNDSLYGIGVAEMVLPFQKALTKWNQMATDNAYLSNIRMFIAKKQSGIEEVPRLYAGRCFFVDDPRSDFIPFAAGDIYPSTLAERQNLFGLVEKRTGVSDYLTGRESPIIGTRATATSTLALIQEGTKRVEEVLENFRLGFAEIIENCFYIWIQFGLEGLDEVVFGDDKIGQDIKTFFGSMSAENMNGAIAIDLSATDAAGNRQAMQQMQLQIIQIMMTYLEKLLAAGQGMIQAYQMGNSAMAELISEVATASRKMFRDLLTKYDIRNPDDYLPDLEAFNNGLKQIQLSGPSGMPNGADGATGLSGMGAGVPTLQGAGVPQPATPGSGAGALRLLQATGQG